MIHRVQLKREAQRRVLFAPERSPSAIVNGGVSKRHVMSARWQSRALRIVLRGAAACPPDCERRERAGVRTYLTRVANNHHRGGVLADEQSGYRRRQHHDRDARRRFRRSAICRGRRQSDYRHRIQNPQCRDRPRGRSRSPAAGPGWQASSPPAPRPSASTRAQAATSQSRAAVRPWGYQGTHPSRRLAPMGAT